MWPLLTENPKAIKAIYREKVPLLQDIYLQELKIVNGEDIQCYLKFDTKELPEEIPSKWIERSVDTVQIELLLIKTDILFVECTSKVSAGNLQIEQVEDSKRLSLINNGKPVFILTAKWLNIQSVTGYSTK
jgi:hypothetical protein